MRIDQREHGTLLLLVAAREQPVRWMDSTSEPAESSALGGINRRHNGADGIGSPHPGGTNVGLRDAGARFISETIELSWLQGLLDGTTEECQY